MMGICLGQWIRWLNWTLQRRKIIRGLILRITCDTYVVFMWCAYGMHLIHVMYSITTQRSWKSWIQCLFSKWNVKGTLQAHYMGFRNTLATPAFILMLISAVNPNKLKSCIQCLFSEWNVVWTSHAHHMGVTCISDECTYSHKKKICHI